MKKRYFVLSAVMVMGMALAGCGGMTGEDTAKAQQLVESTGSEEIQADAPQTSQNDDSADTGSSAQSESQNTSVNNSAVQDTSQASDTQNTGAQVTEEEAKAIALEDAGYTEADVTGIRVKQDRDDGRDIYEVDFYVQAEEFDYDIDRSTGQILSKDYDIDEDFNIQNGQTVSGIITREEAIAIVLNRVEGAAEKDVRIELDQDDGRQIYEGEIYYNQTEYEFELNAQTGEILEWSEER